MSVTNFAYANKRQLRGRIDPSMFGQLGKFHVPQTRHSWIDRHISERATWHVPVKPEGAEKVSNWTVASLWDSDDWLRRIAPVDFHAEWLILLTNSVPVDPVIEVIDEALSILLADNRDDESSVHYQQATMDRVRDFLLSLMREVRRNSSRGVPVPAINPADAGSIDIFWDFEGQQLLVNVSADPDEAITFYGEDRLGTVVSGVRSPPKEAEGVMNRAQSDYLVAWLSASG